MPVGMGTAVAKVVVNRKTASPVVRPRNTTTVGVRRSLAD